MDLNHQRSFASEKSNWSFFHRCISTLVHPRRRKRRRHRLKEPDSKCIHVWHLIRRYKRTVIEQWGCGAVRVQEIWRRSKNSTGPLTSDNVTESRAALNVERSTSDPFLPQSTIEPKGSTLYQIFSHLQWSSHLPAWVWYSESLVRVFFFYWQYPYHPASLNNQLSFVRCT